ncbi:diguanylate cyclase [Burkholderia sp. L27(2015)]|uniref:sensor domain-containing diguanylate cyclase n=1 Tax=Burkholderia sp. L27(2015) TaxID=1641858 RepID=UPI00131DCD1C|nr:diguanylate cyclase [Burkholderia sp. L27(2015)]
MKTGEFLPSEPGDGAAPFLVVAAGVIAGLLVLCLTCVVLLQSRADALELGKQQANTALLLIEHDIARSFEIYDLSLDATVEQLRSPDTRGFSPQVQKRVLFDSSAKARYLGAVKVVDAAGNVTIASQDHKRPKANYSDRDFFAVHRAEPDLGLYISYPYRSRLENGDPAIALSRRIANPDGSFGGIVFLPVYLSYFSDLFSGLPLGSHASITLSRPDGIIITRMPFSSNDVGRTMAGTELGARWAAQTAGSYVKVSQIDGVTRLFVFRKIKALPLIVTVGIAQQDIFEAWQRRAFWTGAIAVVASLLIIVAAVLMAGQLKKRERAEQKLALLVSKDPLTGLDNLRAFDARLKAQLDAAQTAGLPFSVLFIDIDRFMAFNDIYGHAQGDELLRTLARCLSENLLRTQGTASRYGGEEFLILLPNTPTERAFQRAYNICEQIKELNIENRGSEFGRVTVSIGISTWSPEQPIALRALIDAADRALYEAKTLGRNQVRAQSHSSRLWTSENDDLAQPLEE